MEVSSFQGVVDTRLITSHSGGVPSVKLHVGVQ